MDHAEVEKVSQFGKMGFPGSINQNSKGHVIFSGLFVCLYSGLDIGQVKAIYSFLYITLTE